MKTNNCCCFVVRDLCRSGRRQYFANVWVDRNSRNSQVYSHFTQIRNHKTREKTTKKTTNNNTVADCLRVATASVQKCLPQTGCWPLIQSLVEPLRWILIKVWERLSPGCLKTFQIHSATHQSKLINAFQPRRVFFFFLRINTTLLTTQWLIQGREPGGPGFPLVFRLNLILKDR